MEIPEKLKHQRFLCGTDIPGPRKDPEGRSLCRWCGGLVKSPRRTWCSAECVQEYLVRSSGGELARAVFDRDEGVCAECELDTIALGQRLNRMHYTKFDAPRAYRIERNKRLMRRIRHCQGMAGFKFDTSYWQADHIIPVSEGGGCCGLDNIQTLCIWCHRKYTAELAGRSARLALEVPPRYIERAAVSYDLPLFE